MMKRDLLLTTYLKIIKLTLIGYLVCASTVLSALENTIDCDNAYFSSDSSPLKIRNNTRNARISD